MKNTDFEYVKKDFNNYSSFRGNERDYNNFGGKMFEKTFKVGSYEIPVILPILAVAGAFAGKFLFKKQGWGSDKKGLIVGSLAGVVLSVFIKKPVKNASAAIEAVNPIKDETKAEVINESEDKNFETFTKAKRKNDIN